jgi:SpoIID/LytB domain protein
VDQYCIRDALHEKFLYSSAFDVRMERDAAGIPIRVTLRGAGWGHGAGLCQIGALGMALRGYDAAQIVAHYFEGIEVRACY